MKRDTVNYVVVGAFVIAIGIAFLVLMYAISGRTGATETYYTYYRNVTGLKFGTGVFFEGYRVGQIESIEPEGRGAATRYRITLSVREGWGIPIDSVANILSGGLIAAMTIEISSGTSAELLQPGDTIPGAEQTNLFAALSRAANDFGALSRDGLQPLLENLNQRVTELAGEYVALRREDLSPLLASVRTQSESLLRKVDASAEQLQLLLSDENRAKISSTLTNVDGAAAGLNQLVSDVGLMRTDLQAAIGELKNLLADNRPGVTAAVSDLQQALQDLRLVMNNLEQRISGILYNLEGSVRNANEFTREIRENPGSLLRNSPQPERGVAP